MRGRQDDPSPVRCHSGHEYAQRPLSFAYEGQDHQVARVVREARIPDGKQFLVETRSDQVFELTYSESTGAWQIRQA